MKKTDPTSKPSLAVHLLVWLAVPAGEWLIARGLHPTPALWQWGAECAAFAALAVLQWRLAEAPWLKTLLWPPLAVVLTGFAVGGPTAPLSWQVLYLAGLVLLVTSVMKDFGERLRLPALLAFALALASPIVNRALDLDTLEGQISAGFGGIEGSSDELWFELSGAPSAAPTPGQGGPSIILISVDTLRADAAQTMQSWKRLASKGAWWTTTVSSSSWTLPSVASMQTGKSVAEHGADCLVDDGCQGLFPSVRTLAQELGERGYRTAAVTANPWITRSTGLSRGFQTFRDLAGVPPFRLALAGPPSGLPPQDSVVVIDEALAWLDTVLTNAPTASIYLWVHLLGPHMPYSHCADPQMQTITGDELRTGGITGPEFRAQVREAYDGEVAYTDREVGRLLDALEAKGLLEGSIVVLTADHGEEFWEHGSVEHGHSHHGEVTEIPLLIVAPGVTPGERGGVASLVDLAPTLLAMVGIEATGNDLRQPLAADRIATTFGNLYGGSMRSARNLSERVIGSRWGITGEHWQSFDLLADPGELAPAAPTAESRVFDAAKLVEAPKVGQGAAVNREALRALGYAQ